MALHNELGSTMLEVLERYAVELKKRRSILMLAGVDKDVMAQLRLTGFLRKLGRKNVFAKTDIVGESSIAAHEAAEIWIEENAERSSG